MDLYAASLNANFVLNLDTPLVECMWVGAVYGNNDLANFIIAVQGFPMYEFTFNYSAYPAGDFMNFNASYKNYGNQTLLDVKFYFFNIFLGPSRRYE